MDGGGEGGGVTVGVGGEDRGGEDCVVVHGDLEGDDTDNGLGADEGGNLHENECEKNPGLILSELR